MCTSPEEQEIDTQLSVVDSNCVFLVEVQQHALQSSDGCTVTGVLIFSRACGDLQLLGAFLGLPQAVRLLLKRLCRDSHTCLRRGAHGLNQDFSLYGMPAGNARLQVKPTSPPRTPCLP